MTTVIGITGGIGCGKTTVATILSEKLFAPVLDADKISREAMKSQEILDNICLFFSNDIFDSSGNIDRKKISTIAFSDESKLRKLNEIIHPFVMKQIRDKIAELSEVSAYILVDVPIPNKDFFNICNFVITVSADYETRINRVLSRSSLTREEVEQRIKKQMAQNEYESFADVVIHNNADLEKLKSDISILCEERFPM